MSNLVIIEEADGSYDEPKGVAYAEEVVRSRDNTPGVAVQFVDDRTEFYEDASVVGIYDEEIADEFTDEFAEYVEAA